MLSGEMRLFSSYPFSHIYRIETQAIPSAALWLQHSSDPAHPPPGLGTFRLHRWIKEPVVGTRPCLCWLNLQPKAASSAPAQHGLVEAAAPRAAGSFEGCLLPSHVDQPGLQVRSALFCSKQGRRCLQATRLWAAILKHQTHTHLTPANLAGDGN